jgi:hypothetical protein
MRTFVLSFLALVLAVLFAAPAFAGTLGDSIGAAWGWLTDETWAIVITLGLGALAGALGILWAKIVNTIIAVGELFLALGKALEDTKLSAAELADIKRKMWVVVSIWKDVTYDEFINPNYVAMGPKSHE